jgi:glycosyltransferase involved in cell wall biosynthesis
MNPLISVIIPLYNHQNYILSAINSVFDQDIDQVELIVINDGSTDQSDNIIRQNLNSFKQNITYVNQENRGAHNAINRGILMAQGKYLSILNSDDQYKKNRFRFFLDEFDKDPDLEVVFSDMEFIDDINRNINNVWYKEAKEFYNQIGDLSLALMKGNFLLTTSNLFIKRNIFNQTGYFQNLRYAHDLDFFLKLIQINKKIKIIDTPLLNYRMHSSNTINENQQKVRIECGAIIANFLAKYLSSPAFNDKNKVEFIQQLTQLLQERNLMNLVFYFIGIYNKTPEDNYYNLISNLIKNDFDQLVTL